MCFIFVKEKQYVFSMAGIGILYILKIVALLTEYAPSEGRNNWGKQQLLTGRNLVINATVG
jgi:hypothetical protein